MAAKKLMLREAQKNVTRLLKSQPSCFKVQLLKKNFFLTFLSFFFLIKKKLPASKFALNDDGILDQNAHKVDQH
jgi:hypothetical protein